MTPAVAVARRFPPAIQPAPGAVAGAAARTRLEPDELYARGLDAGRMYLRGEDGRRRPAAIARWLGPLDPADECALDLVGGPVLDVGCGPGRHVLALARRGIYALGVDIAPAAVRHARERGASAVLGSVFDPVPGSGGFATALLLDGNIGIGGHPTALLIRLRGLLRPDGSIVCEVDPPGAPTRCELVALEDAAGARSRWFAWARVSIDGIGVIAEQAGLGLDATREAEGRWFAVLNADATRRVQQAAA